MVCTCSAEDHRPNRSVPPAASQDPFPPLGPCTAALAFRTAHTHTKYAATQKMEKGFTISAMVMSHGAFLKWNKSQPRIIFCQGHRQIERGKEGGSWKDGVTVDAGLRWRAPHSILWRML